MFCIKQQTVCLRDGTRIMFKSEGTGRQNIVELIDGDTTHQLHFLKGGEVIRVETLTTRNGAGRGDGPADAPHS